MFKLISVQVRYTFRNKFYITNINKVLKPKMGLKQKIPRYICRKFFLLNKQSNKKYLNKIMLFLQLYLENTLNTEVMEHYLFQQKGKNILYHSDFTL